MNEILRPDLLKLFVGSQEIDNIRSEDGDIYFDARNLDTSLEMEKTIRQSDLEDIESFFANPVLSRPLAIHLLLVMWMREVKFAMEPLIEDNIYDFIHPVFKNFGIDIDSETVEEEFFWLYRSRFRIPLM